MKLEFLDTINAAGDQLVRLYDFDRSEATQFQQKICQAILREGKALDLGTVGFIQSVNCNLTLRLADRNHGISTTDQRLFYCDLTQNGYDNMVRLIEPFAIGESSGYQWLYDLDTPIEFLFSPDGHW